MVNDENTNVKQIYCHCEPGIFPSEHFLTNDNGELVVPHVHVHNVEYKHYTTGVIYSPSRFVLLPASQEDKKSSLGFIPGMALFVGTESNSLLMEIVELIIKRFTKKK